PRLGSAARHLAELEALQDVAHLDVVETAQRQTAFEAFADFGCIVFEPFQTRQVHRLADDGAVAEQTYLRVASDDARGDHTTGDVADLGGAEHLQDLGLTELGLFVLRFEHPLQRRFDLVGGLVDHRVVPNLDTFAVGDLGRLALRAYVEADHDRIRSGGQHHVGLRDGADAAVDHA